MVSTHLIDWCDIGVLNLSGVYQIRNKINNKFYIGSGCNLRWRKKQHLYQLRNNIHHNPHLQSSFNKYGEKSFEFKPLIYCDKNSVIFWEQKLIDILNPEYNMKPIAQNNLGFKFSEKSKKKMSLARLGKAPWNKGKTGVYSEETRVAMGASNKGKIPTEETKRKRQETRKNNLTNRSKK
jgi:group I intron endonuclease